MISRRTKRRAGSFSASALDDRRVTIWLGETALASAALPPTIQRIAGSCRRRSASFTSSYPASRPKTDCLNIPTRACRPFLSVSRIREFFACHRAETKRVVEFAIGEPALEVTTEPRNWSINRRSKSSLRAPSFDSPAGFVMIGAQFANKLLKMIAESRFLLHKFRRHPANAG